MTVGRKSPYIAECLGTFILVLMGTGSVYVAVLTGGLVGLFQVAIVWGLAVGLAIYAFGAISGAHLNPAVTLACWLWREFPARRILPYIGAQLVGGVLAATLLYALFGPMLIAFEQRGGIKRGQPGSELSAMVFGEYFPNPAMIGTDAQAHAWVAHWQAMLAEGLGTAVLVFLIFSLTDVRNTGRPHAALAGPLVGLTVTMLICLLAPLTQGGFNPARDLGPRLVAYAAGWGPVAIPGPRGGFFTVYILAPVLGAVAGGGLQGLVARCYPRSGLRQAPQARAAELAEVA